MPVPKNICQKRFTVTRAVSGLSRAVSQRANSSRFVALAVPGPANTAGTPAVTRSPGRRKSPRSKTRVGTGAGGSAMTRTRELFFDATA